MKLRMLLIAFAALLLLPSSFGQIATLVSLPADLQGELNGVPYLIRVPANWNGTLLVYSYGFADADANTPAPPLAPLPTDVNALLAKGFALAGVHAAGGVPIPPFNEAGWNFKERMQNTQALTAAFRGMVGQPRRTIAWGRSMGGLVALDLIEKFPGLYDGAIALCPLDAGTPRVFDQKLDITLAYAVAFGWNDAWGTPGNLRPDLDYYTEVFLPYVKLQLTTANLWRWEFLRLVNRIPYDNSFYNTMPPLQAPFLFQTMWLAFAPQVDLNKRAGGQVAQNVGRMYTLSPGEILYLKGLRGDPESLLAAMNAQAIYTSDPNARNYAAHYFNPTGRITRPVLTLHTTHDAAVIPNNESAYYAAVKDQGDLELLMQQFTTGVSTPNGVLNTHVTFSPAQYFAAIDAMMYWLDTGNRPDPAVFFPTSLGFDPGYVPPEWPW
jgi:pimeloyl-ACP methyl ester carboxylesterase